jgi:2-methylisocitrate lyase-like PEP mutase family enzyme
MGGPGADLARQAARAAAFRALHARPGAFILPNPWDAGTARLLAGLGFEALATTSLGLANSLGRPDGANLLNVVMSAADPALTAAELAEAGVKRISVGGALSRLALAAFLRGAREMRERGTFGWVRDTVPSRELKPVFQPYLRDA